MRLLFDKDTENSFQDTVRVFRWEDTDNRVTLELPEGFVDMKEEKRQGNYPYEDRPEIIWEDNRNQSQITMQFLEKEMKEADTRKAIQQIGKLTDAAFPQYKRTQEYLFENDVIIIGWFLLYMKDMDKEHIKAIFSAQNKMVLLTLTYPEEKSYKWRPIFKLIFDSIIVNQNHMEVD